MNSGLHLRCLTRADLPFADSVRASEGWNQRTRDWERFLALAPEGCFLAEWQGTRAGTATTLTYGAELAWIGMVLVHPNFRRRGIGTALLRQCIEHLQACGVQCIKLDATPDGKKVYEGMGFQEEWTLTRWERKPDSVWLRPVPGKIRKMCDEDLAFLEPLDVSAFGITRRRLLERLMTDCREALVAESESETPAGHAILREGSRALYLGPVVACSEESALRLVSALVEGNGNESIYWDIPDRHRAVISWAGRNGFKRQRPLTRMFLGRNTAPGLPEKMFAIAGPEVG